MKKSRFSEEQIAYALKQAEAGNKVQEICRQMGISQATLVDRKIYPTNGEYLTVLFIHRRS